MAVKLNDSFAVSTTGVKAPNSVTKFPEGGATFSARISAGGSATVQLRAGVESGAKEILATFTLPCTQAGKAGDLFDSLPVFSIWDAFDWNVTAVSGSLQLSMVGVGV